MNLSNFAFDKSKKGKSTSYGATEELANNKHVQTRIKNTKKLGTQ